MGWPDGWAFGFGEGGGDFRRGAAVEGPGAMDFRQEGVEGEFAVAFEAAEDDAEDGEGHAAEFGVAAVAVVALFEVGLSEAREISRLEEVDEVCGFDAVSDGEGEGFEGGSAGGVFAGEGLEDCGEFGVEEGEEGADEDFGDAAAAGGDDGAVAGEGAFVVGFDVVDLRVFKERADEACDEAAVELGDIAVDVADEVAGGGVEGFPEVFAFAAVGAEVWGDFGGEEDARAGLGGEGTGGVSGAGVDDEEFVDERVGGEEFAVEGGDDGADGFGFVESGDADGDALGGLMFSRHQSGDVGEFRVVVACDWHGTGVTEDAMPCGLKHEVELGGSV